MVCSKASAAGVNLASLFSGSPACVSHCNRTFCKKGGEGIGFGKDE